MERVQILKKGEAPTSETSVWKDTKGFFRCLKCKFKSKYLVEVETHYKLKH